MKKIALLGEPTRLDLCPGAFGHNRRQFSMLKSAMEVRKPDPSVHRDLSHGWLMPAVEYLETQMWGRWAYLLSTNLMRRLPDEPIPPMDFLQHPDAQTRKMLEACLDSIPNHGSGGWRGWSSSGYFEYFLEWFLYGVGHAGQPETPTEPRGCDGASDRLYQVFNAGLMLLNPYDYLGDIAAEMQYGRGQGFYPTPMSLVEMMTRMTMPVGEEVRDKTVLDPCCGTGRMPLHASNHSMRIYCIDILSVMCQATLFNCYLYAPWVARPVGWMEGRAADPATLGRMLSLMAAQAGEDPERSRVAPDVMKYLPVVKREMREGDPATFRAYPGPFARK